MSTQEGSQRAPSPAPIRPEAKSRPEIPPKPSMPPSTSPLPEPTDSIAASSEGKVKSIVSKFSRQEQSEQAEQPGDGLVEAKRFKGPPAVKPKPRRASFPLQLEGQQAPPLPMKRSRRPKVLLEDAVSVECGRSEPDGKEVEIQLNGGVEAEEKPSPTSPLRSSCQQDCSCICHLQWPGMKLVWVPVDEEEELEGEEEDEEDCKNEEEPEGEEEKEEEEEEEEDCEELEVEGEMAEVVNGDEDAGFDVLKATRSKFQQSLDVLMAEHHRRRSDPGPPAVLTFAVTRCQSPPVPPKQADHKLLPQQEEEEEESIYESTLQLLTPHPKKAAAPPVCKELDIPLIRVRKPARRSKLSYSTSDPTSDFQLPPEPLPSPPAIPPRRPLNQEGRSPTPGLRGGVALPQPTAEEWQVLRQSPQHAAMATATTPPPPASISPVRAPPVPPPKTDPRRLSTASVQSLTHRKEADEGETKEPRADARDQQLQAKRESLKKQSSFSWESRLQDEPLYQDYRATVITKEIRRQTVCRNISKTSVDFDWGPHRAGAGPGNGAPRGSPVPSPGQSTLWQELQAVRDSGVLEELTPEQCKYQESMFEVLTSETSYLRSLRVLTEHFMDSRDLEETIIIREKKTLFSNILRVREVSERFLKDLEDRIFEKLIFSDICDIIHYHAQHNFPAYIDYVRNQIYQEKTYTLLMKNNVQFATIITRLQESPQCQRLPFMSFLLLPFQRITRIKMLIENILKRTKEGTPEEQTASKALASVSKIIDECNTQVGKMRQMEELINISQTLEFDKLKAVPIISQTRFLEKKGELQELAKGATLFNTRLKFVPVYLFLFNDLLIIASKKGAERFVVLDHAHRSLVQVQPMDGTSENCFSLTLLENHQGRMMEKLLKAASQSDMHRWMAAFPNPEDPNRDEDEVIYEDWDCPQVQCVEQYVAQQADELTLEPTEIVNVIRKTNEGLYEGIRLADGQKGWFPVSNVIEITNEHVRRRNLRERYRVMRAASLVQKNNTIS